MKTARIMTTVFLALAGVTAALVGCALSAAAEAAGRLGIFTAALLAKGGGRLRARVDLPLVIPTDSTARAQELHLAIGHIVCELVDSAVSTGD